MNGEVMKKFKIFLIIISLVGCIQSEIIGGIGFGGAFEGDREWSQESFYGGSLGPIYPYSFDLMGGYLFQKIPVDIFLIQQFGLETDTDWSYFESSTSLGAGLRIPFFYSSIHPYATVGFLNEKVTIFDEKIKLNSPLFQFGTDIVLPFVPIADLTFGYRLVLTTDGSTTFTSNFTQYEYSQGSVQHDVRFGIVFHKKKSDSQL